jgi:hypothetical protein
MSCLICSHAAQEILHTDNRHYDEMGGLAGLGEKVVQRLTYARAIR